MKTKRSLLLSLTYVVCNLFSGFLHAEPVESHTCFYGSITKTLNSSSYKVEMPQFDAVMGESVLMVRGVDAPDLYSKCEDEGRHLTEEDKARSVTTELDGLLTGEPLFICNVELDNFGRVLGDVYLRRIGTDLGALLVGGGYAKPHSKGNEPWCEDDT